MAILKTGDMRMMRYGHLIFIVVLSFAILLACKTYTGSLPTPDQLDKLGRVPEGLDQDSLSRGRALAMTECADCHRFYFPKEYSPEKWNKVIMKHSKRLSFHKKQIEDINLYFQTASRAEH